MGEDSTAVTAALLHDAIEEKVEEDVAKARILNGEYYDPSGHAAKIEKLGEKARDKYNEIGRRIRNLQLGKVGALLSGFVEKSIGESHRDRYLQEAERASMIIELLTRIEGRDWFEYVSRLIDAPDERDWETTMKQGYYRQGPQRYGERVRSPAIKIKLADKTLNTETTGQFSLEDRLFDAFKGLFILNRTKLFLSWVAQNRAKPKTFEETEEYKYFEGLLKVTTAQLESIKRELRKNPVLLLKTPVYTAALWVYDKEYHGLSRVTERGTVKAKWWEKLLANGYPLEHFAGTLARYATQIYRLRTGLEGRMSRRQLYKDVLLFLENLRRLANPTHIFSFYVGPEMARKYADTERVQ